MNQERFDGLARGLATNRLSRGQVLKAFGAGAFAAMVAGLRGKAIAQAQKPCKIKTVRVWINAFIPDHVSGVTKPHPTNPRFTVLRGPTGTCFLTDQHSFSSNTAAKARMHSEITIDVMSKKILSQDHDCSDTTEIDCELGDVLCRERGKVRAEGGGEKPFFDFQASKDRMRVRLDAAAKNPCFWKSPDIDYQGYLGVEKVSLGKNEERVVVSFGGSIDAFPAYEMYATADGGTPKTLFQRPPPKGNTPEDLFGDAKRSVRGAVTFRTNPCETWQVCCKGQCVNTNSDPSNCGTCRNACKAGQTCKQGKCVKRECPPACQRGTVRVCGTCQCQSTTTCPPDAASNCEATPGQVCCPQVETVAGEQCILAYSCVPEGTTCPV